jgi:hypothetical protein
MPKSRLLDRLCTFRGKLGVRQSGNCAKLKNSEEWDNHVNLNTNATNLLKF